MVLSKSSKSLWDPIRCRYVLATPEEEVRQKWIAFMMGSLGYPKGLIAVEKDLDALCVKRTLSDPNRRIDLLCYTPHKEGLTPLLIVECKADGSGDDPKSQVLGYNFHIQAPFLCVIQGDTAETFWNEGGKIASVPFLPSYAQLVEKL